MKYTNSLATTSISAIVRNFRNSGCPGRTVPSIFDGNLMGLLKYIHEAPSNPSNPEFWNFDLHAKLIREGEQGTQRSATMYLPCI
jgi:hypothetical protein